MKKSNGEIVIITYETTMEINGTKWSLYNPEKARIKQRIDKFLKFKFITEDQYHNYKLMLKGSNADFEILRAIVDGQKKIFTKHVRKMRLHKILGYEKR